MLVIGLLGVILVVLVSQGRWRYFQANTLPDGKMINYKKYAFFGGAILLLGLGVNTVELVALGLFVWAFGPHVELDIRRERAMLGSGPGSKPPGALSVLKHWWKAGGVPKEPPEE